MKIINWIKNIYSGQCNSCKQVIENLTHQIEEQKFVYNSQMKYHEDLISSLKEEIKQKDEKIFNLSVKQAEEDIDSSLNDHNKSKKDKRYEYLLSEARDKGLIKKYGRKPSHEKLEELIYKFYKNKSEILEKKNKDRDIYDIKKPFDLYRYMELKSIPLPSKKMIINEKCIPLPSKNRIMNEKV